MIPLLLSGALLMKPIGIHSYCRRFSVEEFASQRSRSRQSKYGGPTPDIPSTAGIQNDKSDES